LQKAAFYSEAPKFSSEYNALNGLCQHSQLAASASRLSFLKSVVFPQFYYAKLQRRWPVVFHSLCFRKTSPAILIIWPSKRMSMKIR